MVRLSFLLVILVSTACFRQSAGYVDNGNIDKVKGFTGARVRSVRMVQNGKSNLAILRLDDNRSHLREVAVLLTVPTDIGKLRSQLDGQYILLRPNINQPKKQGLKWYTVSNLILAPDADRVVDTEPL